MQRVFPIAPPSRETIYLACASLIFPLGLAGLFFLINYSAKNVTFVCHNDSLRIKGSMYARTIPRSAIDLPQAKIIDLGAAPPYRLHRRINGTAVKGYREGWFRLNNRRKALVFVTDPTKVVILPTRQDYIIMFSAAQPERLLEALEGKSPQTDFTISPAHTTVTMIMLLPTAGALAVPALLFYLAHAGGRIRFTVLGDTLRIQGLLRDRKIARKDLRRENIRRVNLDYEQEFKPSWRTWGIGLPGCKAGWFRLKSKEKALLFLTDRQKAVYIPTTRKYCLLLSPNQPDEFVRALQQG